MQFSLTTIQLGIFYSLEQSSRASFVTSKTRMDEENSKAYTCIFRS